MNSRSLLLIYATLSSLLLVYSGNLRGQSFNINYIPKIYDTVANPYRANMYKGINLSNPAISITSFNDADEVFLISNAYMNPQSQYFMNSQAYTRLIALLDAFMSSWDTVDYTQTNYDTSGPLMYGSAFAYCMLKTLYPGKIPPDRQPIWERGLAKQISFVINKRPNLYTGRKVGAVWLNADDQKTFSVMFGSLALGDTTTANMAKSIYEDVFTKCLLDDGGTHYLGYNNEAPAYHELVVKELLQFWLYTRSPKVELMLKKMQHYSPLMKHVVKAVDKVKTSSGFVDYGTAPSDKDYYNALVENYSGAASAYLNGDGYNYTIGKAVTSDFLLAFLWTPGIASTLTALDAPDRFMLYDQNSLGPRGRYGPWGVSGTVRDPSSALPNNPDEVGFHPLSDGKNSFVSAYMLDTISTKWDKNSSAFNAAFQSAAVNYKANTGVENDWGRGGDGIYRFITANENNAISRSAELYGITTKYNLSHLNFKVYAPYVGTQQWVVTKDRVIGMMELKCVPTSQKIYGLGAHITLIGGRANAGIGSAKNLLAKDKYTYEFGSLKTKIHTETFGGIIDTAAWNVFGGGDTWSRVIKLHDVLDHANDAVITNIPANYKKYVLWEITNNRQSYATASVINAKNDSLISFQFTEDAGREVRMVHNFSGVAVTYTDTMRCVYNSASVINSWDNSVNTIVIPQTDHIVTISPITIPPYSHILIVNSNIQSDHVAKYNVYKDVFPLTKDSLSHDATLNKIYLPGVLSPSFSPATTNYTLALPAQTTSVVLQPIASDPYSTILVNGVVLPNGSRSGTIAVSNGSTITISVKAQDVNTVKTYTINIVPGYYSKPTGDLSSLATYGTSADGTGTAPADFKGSGSNATYQLANRTNYVLTNDLSIGTSLNISNGSSLDLAGNTLTLNRLVGSGTLIGSNTSSLTVNGNISNLSFATGKEQLNYLTLGDTASLTLTSSLNIASTGAIALGANSVFNTGGFLTLRSNSSGTAQISVLPPGATINGNATVERYLYDKRGWRLIASPVNSTQTINTAWQEGASNKSADPNPGYGTLLIGNNTANGFDIGGTSGSLLVYDETGFISAANTNALTVSSNPGYFLFSIGNRSVDPTVAGSHSSTILRTTGTFLRGPQIRMIKATGYTLVGNPYAAPVDFSRVTRSSSVQDNFYAWDVKLGNYGGYVLVTNTGGNNYTSVPLSPSGLSNIIPSGASFFVRSDGSGAGTLTFNENAKATGAFSGTFSNFSTSTGTTRRDLRVNLTDADQNLIDGVMVNFAAANSNKVDASDALKIFNFNENIAIARAGKLLMMERRSDISANDTITIRLSGVKVSTYQLQIDPADFNKLGITAYVEDAYLHARTQIDLNQLTNIQFTTNTDTASYKERFKIVLSPGNIDVTLKTTYIGASVIAFPNPATRKEINLSFDGMTAGKYDITVINSFGGIMQKSKIDYDGNFGTKLLSMNYSTGIYTVNIRSNGYYQAIKIIVP